MNKARQLARTTWFGGVLALHFGIVILDKNGV